MKSKHPFQIFVLLTLLFSPFGANQPVRASTSAVDKLDTRNIDRNFLALQDQPTVSMVVNPSSVNAGEITTVTVSLNHVPAEGYTSAELTCTYDPDFVEASNIVIGNLFGLDPVTAINGPHNGQFIVAIAGSNGKKAISSGVVLTFNVTGLQAGQSPLGCQARVSTGDRALTSIASIGTKVTVLENVLTPTVGPTLCDKVQLVADITVPDGTNFPPGATFTKTWRLKNAGSCTWITSYQLVFFSGEQMGTVSSVSFPRDVQPGQVVDISVNLIAPSSPGSYRGYWMFKNANGALFGIGAQANRPWWVDIRVSGATATPTFSPTPCDKAEFIADVNVPPGTVMSPGAQFIKTWRLKNVGSCTWTISYRLAFLSGDLMGAPSSIQLFRDVPPGATVDLSLNMIAPSSPGSYRGYWIFQNSTGQPFGVGSQGNEPWIVDILVANGSVTPTPTQPSSILKLTKIASSQTYSGPDQTITYTFTITNMGTAVLDPAQFTITDNKLGAPFNCGPADLTLAPNQSVACSSDYKTTSADMALPNIINSATASGAGQTSAVATAVVTNLAAPATPTPNITPSGSTATPILGTAYDFTANACEATWFSGAGQLPCPGIDGNANGFVYKVDNPKLESGAIDSRPGLLTFPQNGYIQGFYPRFRVQNGDRFRATVGCEGGATNCYVAFRLDYEVGGTIRPFWGPFLERYDGRSYSIDVNLSPLAGQDVRFILTLLSAGVATGDRALWVGPIIYRANAESTPTSEPMTETPSTPATPTFTATPSEEPYFTPTPNGSFTPTSTSVSTTGTVTGQVLAGKQVILDLFDADNWPVAVAFANADGTFSLTAQAGTYNLVARAPGFLSAMGPVTIPAGGTTSKPTITLLPGDIDSNFVINWLDVVTIGINYNNSYPSEADLNSDGVINVLDLELLAKNYRKIGPVGW
jgi:hypothetical protein